MKVIFIRHGKTKGNLEKRYIGRTDEEILPIINIGTHQYEPISAVYTSEKKRCIQTANLIYPSVKKITVSDINECDFGDFEGKTYEELKNNNFYQEYISSGGKKSPPNGENIYNFKKRCYNGYKFIIDDAKNKGYENIAVVTHGGVIMTIFEKYSNVNDFYFWQIPNLGFIKSEIDEEKIIDYKIFK